MIQAGTDADAWFGLGFCHGQDRAAQLDFVRRAVRGTLAELVGPSGLAVDRLTRRIGLWRSAVAQLPALDPDVRATLDAYARGVTAGVSPLGLPRRPHEFAILGGRPGAWDAADVAAYLKLQALLVGANWDVELARLQLLLADGPDAVAALDPAPANNGPFVDPRPGPGVERAADRLAADLKALAAAVSVATGSNAWVVGGSKTATGRPLMANDPHVAPTLPAPWYLAHVRTPEWAVCGATAVGALGVMAGHNGFCAWGSAAGLQDNTDLFLEEVGPDGRSVREADGAFHPCEVIREVIQVRGRPDVVEDVLITPRGPVVSLALEGVSAAISMRAVWLDPLPARGLFDAPRARSFDQFRGPSAAWPLTPQHLVYADTTGTVGWQLAGQVPVRRSGFGLVPVRGSDPAAGWAGLVPFADMPYAVDPPSGFIVAANNPPRPDGAGPYLGDDWANGYRAGVITDALAARADWDVAGCQQLQLSRRAKPWEEIRDVVLAAPAADPDAARALVLLRAWDGNLGPDTAAGTVYVFFLCELAERVTKAKAPRGWEWALGKGFGGLVPHTLMGDRRFAHLVKLVTTQPAGWFPRPWPDEIAAALGDAVRRIGRETGRPAEAAAWGVVRPLRFKHLVFGDVRGVRRAFNPPPLPGGGDSNTPFQGTVQPLAPLSPPAYTPNLRLTVDVGAWENSRYVIAGGQSGNPLSPHYTDLLAVWRTGGGVPIPWTPAEIAEATVATLELIPATAGTPLA